MSHVKCNEQSAQKRCLLRYHPRRPTEAPRTPPPSSVGRRQRVKPNPPPGYAPYPTSTPVPTVVHHFGQSSSAADESDYDDYNSADYHNELDEYEVGHCPFISLFKGGSTKKLSELGGSRGHFVKKYYTFLHAG